MRISYNNLAEMTVWRDFSLEWRMNLAVALTALRLLLAPFVVLFLLQGHFSLVLLVFGVAGVSDGLDGYVARRYGMASRLGAFLDPVADKVLVASTVITLTWIGRLPLWFTLVVVARDVLIMGGALAYHVVTARLEMAPTFLGKLNTFLQLSLLLSIVLDAARWLPLAGLLPYAYALVALTTALSGVEYVLRWGGKALSKEG